MTNEKEYRRIDVSAELLADDGTGDGAYDLVFERACPEKFCKRLLAILKDDNWGLSETPDLEVTLRLEITRTKPWLPADVKCTIPGANKAVK